MTYTGTQLVTAALRELGVLGSTATASGDRLSDGITVGSDLLDSWRTEHLLVSGITIATYSLVSGTQSYTIGSGGTFDQTYPTAIELWSVIPDDDAADPNEIPMGRPLTYAEWQQIRVKSSTGARPTSLYYDRAWAAGVGNILVYPIPDNNDVDIKLYAKVPAITSLVAGTSYNLAPACARAIKLNLALELADRYGAGGIVSPRLEQRAADAKMLWKRSNIIPKESPMRGEFAIGSGAGRRTFNVYTGS